MEEIKLFSYYGRLLLQFFNKYETLYGVCVVITTEPSLPISSIWGQHNDAN
jgi:hypothetical protein